MWFSSSVYRMRRSCMRAWSLYLFLSLLNLLSLLPSRPLKTAILCQEVMEMWSWVSRGKKKVNAQHLSYSISNLGLFCLHSFSVLHVSKTRLIGRQFSGCFTQSSGFFPSSPQRPPFHSQLLLLRAFMLRRFRDRVGPRGLSLRGKKVKIHPIKFPHTLQF